MQTRHDPYYYLPKFVRLEARVTARSTARLRDYVLALSGGSTPKKEEEEKYYADAESGIPFVRVQNLNVDSHLSLDYVKYVNRETHEGLLNRSKVLQDDLLVKITGVGRMAVASVPPIGFEGNINQHIARIRTESRATSEALAAWLNTDIAETLAKRRSTGGTRPALDYPALRSIPVIFDEKAQQELSEAYKQYKQAEAKARELLTGIDEYLMSELCVSLPPEPENTIANRIFTLQSKALVGWRFDARVHQYNFNLHSARHPNLPLKQLAHINPRTVFSHIKDETPLTFIPMESISDEDGTIAEPQQRNYSENVGYTSFQEGDLLWAKITPCMENGKSAVAQSLLNGFGFGSTEYHVLRPKSGDLSVHYLHAILRMKRLRKAAESYFGGSSGHQRVDEAFFYRLTIPVPPPEVQEQLAKHIESMRQEAQQLRSNALAELNATKLRIEAMLLGEGTA